MITDTGHHLMFEGKSSQDIKDILFALIGRPDRIGMKNTPPRYGGNTEEIKGAILRIMQAQMQNVPAYGGYVENKKEEMPRAKKETVSHTIQNVEGSPIIKKRTCKKKVVCSPAPVCHLPLTTFHFPSEHIPFLVNMDVISCDTVETMVIHTSHKKQYAYNSVTELYYLIGKDGKLGEGIEII